MRKKVEQKEPDNIDYLRMALALSGISIDRFHSELVIETWSEIQRKGGKFSISDSVSVEWRIRKKYQRVKAVNVHKTNKK